MFPLPWNKAYRKKDGSLTTIHAALQEAGSAYQLPTASAETKGGIKIGSGLAMDGEVLNNSNPTPYSLPTASAETKGGVKIGSGLTMDGEVLNNSNPTPYSLPTASAETLGGVKVGSGLSITDGVLSATGGGTSFTVETIELNASTAGKHYEYALTPPEGKTPLFAIYESTFELENSGNNVPRALSINKLYRQNGGGFGWKLVAITDATDGISFYGKVYVYYV